MRDGFVLGIQQRRIEIAYARSSNGDDGRALRAEIETQLATVEAERAAALLWAKINFMLPETYGSTLPRAEGADPR